MTEVQVKGRDGSVASLPMWGIRSILTLPRPTGAPSGRHQPTTRTARPGAGFHHLRILDHVSPDRLLNLWNTLGRSRVGRWIFSRLIGLAVPYSGSIRASVESLQPGRAILTLRDRRAVRQHLGAVHAIALANLAELASGMAMLASLGPDTRGIVININISYHKKARGVLRATGTAAPPQVNAPVASEARAEIHDEAGDRVAEAVVTWRLDLR